ncbi:hypothetical protein A2313_01065 [Candidatus Roizmanbacteria bacterium RIFOXYB2_FULL_41_10]|uniref:26 kDa periplasmic immunogenic protein n=1 Tax=Candidatus Roizmanbacteria bacterium RIFOXYA1_FULL_41_12 TaxID=1802082 RepID=A0A1F7KEG3_9BACT|nr:MAG: hypothetical protein A2209_01205 [Candidatus Roizmanbacteria bacterium RIFOXYA1_FULL_41_12]OGK67385.1 MAG: hypothetical protein A2377_01235 [Candidatus Roizmanbacteria bacterium RIFOXYB1_FULL_41_27]OGK68091.1 MAG: hypothetical protein A2262_04480 [Candidatus Roizmanbacteria bacterium RIFOXYA2_FULL_41_8]OGK71169.1 MAG: hypothetical protein A2313_01065 [Candidatus Roizmanbacteria bacterium RIFOXYB2_FULL_41_10]OGK71620.1 MAG: hypothetical protein A2403_02705 [Candidatus Roizmanbacteria bac
MENKTVTSTYAAILVLTIIALSVIKYFNISYPISVSTSQVSRELSVVGEGKVEVIPDTAVVEVGVTVNNIDTARQTQNQLTQTNNQIISALTKIGVAKKDIKTTNISIYPNYSYDGAVSDIIGYNGNATLSVTVKNVSKASEVVDVATQNGANEVRGPNFTLNKPEKYREEARNKAIDNAKEQAEKLAKNLGIRLGKIVNIVESSPISSQDYYYPRAAAEGMGGGGPTYEPGSQTITSTVTLYFEKK